MESLENENFLSLIDEALTRNPNDIAALKCKAEELISRGHYQEGLDVLEKISTLCPSANISKIISFWNKFIKFIRNFKKNCLESIQYPENWYDNRIFKRIEHERQKEIIENYDSQDGRAWIIDNEKKYYSHDMIPVFTRPHPFPNAQLYHNRIFHHDQIFPIQYINKNCLLPFKTMDWKIPENANILKPHSDCDLYISDNLIDNETHCLIVKNLDRLANITRDFFVENYQNIIDPNLTVSHQPKADALAEYRKPSGDSKGKKILRWTATDFLIDDVWISQKTIIHYLEACVQAKTGKEFPQYVFDVIFSFLNFNDKNQLKLMKGEARIASPISTLDPMKEKELHIAAENVLNAALPLLSKLRTPALLFPGKLQCVMKAQRIYLHPGEEYSGVWHYDGKNENIVAVILYYYRVSEDILGGDLEFMEKLNKPIDLTEDSQRVDFSFTHNKAKTTIDEVPHCHFPIKTGTLVVFSNYQLIHRVLKMKSQGKEDPTAPGGFASRDFLAFFVVDQRSPLSSTNEFTKNASFNNNENLYEIRRQLFFEQLQPTGQMGNWRPHLFNRKWKRCNLRLY